MQFNIPYMPLVTSNDLGLFYTFVPFNSYVYRRDSYLPMASLVTSTRWSTPNGVCQWHCCLHGRCWCPVVYPCPTVWQCSQYLISATFRIKGSRASAPPAKRPRVHSDADMVSLTRTVTVFPSCAVIGVPIYCRHRVQKSESLLSSCLILSLNNVLLIPWHVSYHSSHAYNAGAQRSQFFWIFFHLYRYNNIVIFWNPWSKTVNGWIWSVERVRSAI